VETLELVVVRHGQSVADIENRHEGRADFSLTDLGREQAERLARWIARECPPTVIWSSPLKRAAEVAQLISEETGIAVKYHGGLMEWNNGVLAGMLKAEAEVKYARPAAPRKLHERVPDGESEIEFRARAEAMFSEILHATDPDARVVIVSHGGMITMLYRAFLRLPVETDIWVATGDTGVHRWAIQDGRRIIRLANSTEHLRTGP
jgi:2,3-bisphosphoglycerate-dependent phosphoglycerate mutase